MTELEAIQHRAKVQQLEFLLIGGLAVIEHGFPRVTTDIDLLVRKRDQGTWKGLARDLGYQPIREADNFHQYERPEITTWPLDLMLVNDITYDRLAEVSLPAHVMGASVQMVSLKHLIALKLHVLKQGKLDRFLDDFIDVVELVKANRLDLQTEQFRALFIRYGTADLYDKVRSVLDAE
jgi:hypothetical protein